VRTRVGMRVGVSAVAVQLAAKRFVGEDVLAHRATE
jgi:hypothetical protein